MRTNIFNPDRSTPKTTAIMRSQRASCVVQVFRFDELDIAKLISMNAANEKSLAGVNKPAAGNLKTKSTLTIRNDIIRCNITHNKSSPSGTFSVVLKKGKQVSGGQNLQENIDYVQAVHPGDWIAIYMKKNGDISDSELNKTTADSGFKFLGIVENVRYVEVDSPDKGAPRLEYIITGRSFGKVFETSLFFNPQVNSQTIQTILGAKFLTNSPTNLGGNNPGVVVKKLIEFFMGGGATKSSGANDNWYIPRGVALKFKSPKQVKSRGNSFSDILNTNQIGLHRYTGNKFRSAGPLPGAVLVKSLPSSGSIWAVMQFLNNSIINEMYTELVPDTDGKLKPAVVMRQLPFSNKRSHETSIIAAHQKYNTQGISDGKFEKTYFVDLPRHEIVSSDIIQKNIGKSEHERLNYAIVTPKIDSNTFDVGYVASSNIPSVQRYGLKVFQGQTSYVLSQSVDGAGKDGIRNYCEECVKLIQDWFFMSHNLYNGTIIVDGLDTHVPVGTNLYVKDDKQLFHIEGYTHNYEIADGANTAYTTEFRVSRGQTFNGQVAKFIGVSRTPNDPTTVAVSFLPNERRRA
jgi:hypothetical protein